MVFSDYVPIRMDSVKTNKRTEPNGREDVVYPDPVSHRQLECAPTMFGRFFPPERLARGERETKQKTNLRRRELNATNCIDGLLVDSLQL